MKTNLQGKTNLRLDPTAIKILFSTLAILGASLYITAFAATGPIQFVTSIHSVLTENVKTFPALYLIGWRETCFRIL